MPGAIAEDARMMRVQGRTEAATPVPFIVKRALIPLIIH